jgi:hypothetical protein
MSLTNEDLLALSNMMDQKLQPINDRLDDMDKRLDKIESEVLVLKKETRVIKDKVSDTYNLALEAWGQSTENRTWLEQNQAMG